MPENKSTTAQQQPAFTYPYIWIAISLMATILVAGIIISETAQNFLNNNAEKAFVARARIAAAGIDASLVKSLTVDISDTTSTAYKSVKQQLITIKAASNDMRFVYLMGKQKNQVIFLVDAEPADSKDYSPPGQIYPNPSDYLMGIFETGNAFVEGPITDDWGTWISGHAPIIDSDNGQILAIIGIDIDAVTWQQTINLYRWGSIGIILLLVILVLVYFISLWRISHANAERRDTADKLEQAVAKLHNTNKELESFSYSVSHDLRAPLRHIHGYSEALEEDYSDKLTGEGLTYLQRLRHAVLNMDRLILGLLKLSRVSKQGLNIEKVDLGQLAQEVIEDLNTEYKDQIYQTSVAENLICYGDIRLLRIVLENLLSNAYKYSFLTPNPRIEIGATEVEGETAYYVKDNGIGFDMAYQDKIFEPFQRLQTENQYEGSGIGLSTVVRIIHRHKGRIWAEAIPDQGAKFYFTLGLVI